MNVRFVPFRLLNTQKKKKKQQEVYKQCIFIWMENEMFTSFTDYSNAPENGIGFQLDSDCTGAKHVNE